MIIPGLPRAIGGSGEPDRITYSRLTGEDDVFYVPEEVNPGDVIVAAVANNGDTPDTPSGFTRTTTFSSTENSGRITIFTKTADGNEGTVSCSGSRAAVCVVIEGAFQLDGGVENAGDSANVEISNVDGVEFGVEIWIAFASGYWGSGERTVVEFPDGFNDDFGAQKSNNSNHLIMFAVDLTGTQIHADKQFTLSDPVGWCSVIEGYSR